MLVNFPVLVKDGVLTEVCDTRRGIYCWVNTKNNKKYVGMAAGKKGFLFRLQNEISAFKRDTHHGTQLLALAVAKYGLESFVVIELLSLEAEPDIFAAVEQYYISTLKSQSPNGYNITSGGSGTLGYSNLTGANKRRGVPNHGVAKANSKRYELISPEGVRHYIHNLAAFERSLGLPVGSLHNLTSGGAKSCHGWSLGTCDRYEYAKSISSTAYFVSPEGLLTKVVNIRKFADFHKIAQGALNGVWKQRKSYHTCRGWRRATEEEIDSFDSTKHQFWDYDKWYSTDNPVLTNAQIPDIT